MISNPSAFNLFTQTHYAANYNSGLLAGRAEVTNSPGSFGLVATSSLPRVLFAAGRAVSFNLSMTGQWTRFAQSEALPRGWSFNTNTGVLRGRIPIRGKTKATITPYQGTNASLPISFEFQPR